MCASRVSALKFQNLSNYRTGGGKYSSLNALLGQAQFSLNKIDSQPGISLLTDADISQPLSSVIPQVKANLFIEFDRASQITYI